MNTKVPNVIIFDTETGGLKADKAAITQMCFFLVSGDTLEVIETVNEFVTPHYSEKYCEYNLKALEVTGFTMEMLEDRGIDIKELGEKFKALCLLGVKDKERYEKPVIYGHNTPFDYGFLQQLAEVCGFKLKDYIKMNKDLYGNEYPSYLDNMTLAKIALPEQQSFKLVDVTKSMGVEVYDAHKADNDVEFTYQDFRKMALAMRNGATEVKKADNVRHFQFKTP